MRARFSGADDGGSATQVHTHSIRAKWLAIVNAELIPNAHGRHSGIRSCLQRLSLEPHRVTWLLFPPPHYYSLHPIIIPSTPLLSLPLVSEPPDEVACGRGETGWAQGCPIQVV